MSDLICRVGKITEIKKHPNADSLELAIFGGWQVVVKKEQFNQGDIAIHIPPDSMVPKEVAEKWGVDSYLSFRKDFPSHGRVRSIRLREEVSHGFLVHNNDNLALDDNARDFYDIQKYEPPMPAQLKGEVEKHHSLFDKYTDIQNERNFPNVFIHGEDVVALEKIHGSNNRIGFVKEEGIDGVVYKLMVGSNNLPRKIGAGTLYEKPLEIYPQLEDMLKEIWNKTENPNKVIVFGEIYGWVQDLRYGALPNQYMFRVFDIKVNDQYMGWDDVVSCCKKYDIPIVPVIYRGPFDRNTIWEMASGKTLAGGNNIREGLVVKTVPERQDEKLGRVILKFVSDDYLQRKDGTEYH